MLSPIDGYSEQEARELIGQRVTQTDQNVAANAEAKQGVIIAHDFVQLKPGVQEHCVWVQWDGSDKAHQFTKLNEGKDFHVDVVDRSPSETISQQPSLCPSGMPASKQQIEAYKKLLSQPNFSHEMSPIGTVTNSYDPERDRKIMASIMSTEAKLAETKDKAKASFNSKANEQHLRTRFNRSSGMSM
jgi:hypothetical protein